MSILKVHLFPLGEKVTDNAFVHYGEGGKAIHHGCVHVQADCMQVALHYSGLYCGYGGGLGDAKRAEHLETRTLLSGVKRGRVMYLVAGRGNSGSSSLMKNCCSLTHCQR